MTQRIAGARSALWLGLAALAVAATLASSGRTAPAVNSAATPVANAISPEGAALSAVAKLAGDADAQPPKIDLPDFALLPRARVTSVAGDGTLRLQIKGKAVRCRLAGMMPDEASAMGAPTLARRGSAGASSMARWLGDLLIGEEAWVAVAEDGPERDAQGRLLGFLFRAPDGLFVNLEVVRQGRARVDAQARFAQKDLLLAYQARAQAAGKGLWAVSATATAESGKSPVSDIATGAVPIAGTRRATASAASLVAPGGTIVFVTANGTKYHRAGCRFLGKNAIAMSLSEARKRYQPCRACKPPQ
jgi:endonuclease YncB( thermonuclease family)